MKLIDTKDAVGHVLCHDITRIVKGESKGPVFKKGHVVREEDIPVLLSVGKEHLYIWENDENMLHENDAALIMRDMCQNEHMASSDISEGKIELIAECDGILKINRQKLHAINALGEMMIATRHGDTPVHEGDKLAGMRVIPLVIEKEKMARAQAIAGDEPILTLLPFMHKKVAIVTTGSEVFTGRIKDTFTPVLEEKLSCYDTEIIYHEVCDDKPDGIEKAIRTGLDKGADMILVSGGMSVDPDDKTPLAIRNATDEVITYGAPVLPGAMFMLAYTDDHRAIMGLPGCVMYSKKTIFDLILPRVIAGETLVPEDFSSLGEGGLCLQCDMCTYPNCGFGKGHV